MLCRDRDAIEAEDRQEMTPRISTDKTQRKREMSVAARSFFTLILLSPFCTGREPAQRKELKVSFVSPALTFSGVSFHLRLGAVLRFQVETVRAVLILREIWAYRVMREQLIVRVVLGKERHSCM